MLGERDLTTNYPYPIVAAYIHAQKLVLGRSVSARDKVKGLTALAETVAKYTAALVVAQYCAYGRRDKEMDNELAALAREPANASFSIWIRVLEHGLCAFERSGLEGEAIVPAEFLGAAHQGELLELYQTLCAFVSRLRKASAEKLSQVSCFHVLESMAQLHDLIEPPSRPALDNDLATLDHAKLLTGLRAVLGEMRFLAQYPLVYVESASASAGPQSYDARIAMGAVVTAREPLAIERPLIENHFYILYPEQDEPLLCLGPLLKYEDEDIVFVPEPERDQLRHMTSLRRRTLFGLTPQSSLDSYAQAARDAMEGGTIAPSQRSNLDRLAAGLGIPTWLACQLEDEVKSSLASPPEPGASQLDSPKVEWSYELKKPVRKIAMGRLADSPRVWVVTAGDESSGDALYLLEGKQPPRLVPVVSSRVETVACSERGGVFAAGCWNGLVSVVDAQGRPKRGPHNLGNVVKALALSPDGLKLAATTWGESAFLFDLERHTALREVQLADAGQSIAIGISIPKVEAASDATPQEERPASGTALPTQEIGPLTDDQRTDLRQKVVAHFEDEELRDLCFDLGVEYKGLPGEGATAKARELIAHLDRVGRIPELIKKCRKLRPGVSWWGESPAASPTTPASQPKRVSMSQPTTIVAVGTYHGWVSLLEEGDVEPPNEEIGDSVVHLAIAEGNKVIAACADGRVTSLDGQERRSYRVSGTISDLAVSRDGHKIVVAYSGRRLAFLNEAGGQLRSAHPHDPELDSDIVHVAVSDDGRWCLAVTAVGTLYVFEEIYERRRWLLGQPPVDMAISADARRLAVAFADGVVRFYTLPAGLVPAVEPKIEILNISPSQLNCARLSILEIQVRNKGDGVAREVSANIISSPLEVRSQAVLASLRPDETSKLHYNVRANEPGEFMLEFEITYRGDSGGEVHSEIIYTDDNGALRTGTRYSMRFKAE
jgi:WD40 repeat protein